MKLSKLKDIWTELKEGTLESEIYNDYNVTYGKGESEELKKYNFFRFNSEKDYKSFVELFNDIDKTIEYYKHDLIEMGFEDDLTEEKKIVIDIIEKLDNEIVELENENAKIRMYRGAINGRECNNISNPLFITKGLVVINSKDKKFEITNNTADIFESTLKVNEDNGFRNLAKELYSKGYRIDEVYYNEYSEFPGYESIEIFDSEYYDANEKLNSHIFDNNKILNRELLHVGYKNNYDKDDITDWDYHSYRNWFHIFEDFTNGEFLVIEIIDKENIVYNKKIIYDPQCFNENIEELITKYKLY